VIGDWLEALQERHLRELTFAELTRALRALSSTYVERRERLARKSAFDSAGKRAAYALYYSPLHYLAVTEIARALGLANHATAHIADLGCGAGAAGAAWAMSLSRKARVSGVDAHPWAVAEAAFTYRVFALDADTHRSDAARWRVPRSVDAIVAGWMLNELTDRARAAVQTTLRAAVERSTHVLIVEPIATRVSPWWPEWAREFEKAGGRADEWRFRVPLPEFLARLDRAAGLRHDVLTARTLFFRPQAPGLRPQGPGGPDELES
jgi:SAM-dependent methyltransferase